MRRKGKWRLIRFSFIRGLALFHYSKNINSGFKNPEYYSGMELLVIWFLCVRLEYIRWVDPPYPTTESATYPRNKGVENE